MDRGLETTVVKAIASLAVILYAGALMAQSAGPMVPQATPEPRAVEPAGSAAEPAVGTSIFGSTALPKGLTIVPWQGADSGQITSSPIRQVTEPLEAIDPAEFRRRLKYHQQSDTK